MVSVNSVMKVFQVSLMLLFCATALALEDKIVASVENQVITESDIKERYHILFNMRAQSHNIPPYNSSVRESLLEQLIDDQVLDLVWKSSVTSDVELVSDAELQDFIHQYRLSDLREDSVKQYYELQRKRRIIARDQFEKKVHISDGEVESYLQNGFNWSLLPMKVSFKIAYDDIPLNSETAGQAARSFDSLAVSKVPSAIFSKGRWELRDKWQFFKQDDEFVALMVEDYKIEGLLDQQYKITWYEFESQQEILKEQVSSYHSSHTLPENVTLLRETDLVITHSHQIPKELMAINFKTLSQGESIQLSGDNIHKNTFIYVQNISPLSHDHVSQYVRDLAKDELLYRQVEQSFNFWLEQTRATFYVGVV